MLDNRYFSSISMLFKSSSIRKIANSGDTNIIKYILNKSGYASHFESTALLSQIFDGLYDLLVNNYRNEYVYKNAIINKILLGHYSLNTASMISEFRVNQCKADIVLLNNTSTVYEIKTKYDTLERLESQICAYHDFFDKIYVVIDESMIKNVDKLISKNVGIYVLTRQYTLKEFRKAQSNKKNVNPSSIMSSLRKEEYLSIIKKEYGYIPDVVNTRTYSESLKIFSKLSPQKAHDNMIKVLKKRASCVELNKFVNDMPKSLKFSCLNANLRNNERVSLENIMKSKYSLLSKEGS